MSKIIILIGISNSGKSTFAHEQWKADPLKTVVINRDKIRELLFSYTEETVKEYYLRPDLNKLEKQVTKYEDTLIHEALNEDKTVILDATHLRKEYLERFKFWNVPIELKWFDITLKEALTRNMGRKRQVDLKVIEKQYSQYLNIRNLEWDYEPIKLNNDIGLPKCVLVDIDGTLAHMGNRRTPFDWKNVGMDFIDTKIKSVVNSLQTNVFVCTGRDGACIDETVKWLNNNDINYDKVYIRKSGDMRPDWKIKYEIWEEISRDYYIDFLIDDRNQVCRYARSLGLKVLQVEYGNF